MLFLLLTTRHEAVGQQLLPLSKYNSGHLTTLLPNLSTAERVYVPTNRQPCCIMAFLEESKMRPTYKQQLAIEAMLNTLLGANEYDRLCLGMKVGGVDDDILQIFVPTEHCAAEIERCHSDDFAVAAQHVFRLPIRIVTVLPMNFRIGS
jgi:hypothetical protein